MLEGNWMCGIIANVEPQFRTMNEQKVKFTISDTLFVLKGALVVSKQQNTGFQKLLGKWLTRLQIWTANPKAGFAAVTFNIT